MSPEKKKALDTALSAINKQFGDGSINRLGDKPPVAIDSFSTGSLGLDVALGIGGLPRGRIIEIYGPESSGKTTLTLSVIAQAQKAGATCAFVDAEHALDPIYAAKLGVNVDNLLVSQPDTGEQALEITDMLVRSNAVDVLIVDSVAALVPKAEIEGEMGDMHVGLQARLMSQALRKITGNIKNANCLVIFINQIRMKIGVMFGSPETTTGGNALKFYASVRLDIRRTGAVKEGEEVVGSETRVKVVKNKVASPFKQAEFQILYGKGIYLNGEMIDLGVLHGFVEKSGAWYAYNGTKIGQGKANSAKFLADNPQVAAALEKQLRDKLLGNNSQIEAVKPGAKAKPQMAALQLRPAVEIQAPVQIKQSAPQVDEEDEFDTLADGERPSHREDLDDDEFFAQPMSTLMSSETPAANLGLSTPVDGAPAGSPTAMEPASTGTSWFDKAVEKDLIYKQGPSYFYEGQLIAKGKVAAKLAIEANLGLFNTIQTLIS